MKAKACIDDSNTASTVAEEKMRSVMNFLPNKKPLHQIAARVSKDLFDKVHRQSKKDGFSIKEIIEAGLQAYLSERGEKK
jgi:hypothetical protein